MTGRRLEEEGCRGIRFKNVTPDVFKCMKKKLEEYGLEVSPGNSGVLEGNEIVAHFTWDGEEHLVIEVKEKPWHLYCGALSGQMRAFMRECQGR